MGSSACLDDVEKNILLTLPGLELQPVASHYADYANPSYLLFTLA
jgi:hypothetical protein